MSAQPHYRILAVAATPFFVDRGGHIHIYEPIKALQKLGHEVTLVTYSIGRDLPDVDIRRMVKIPWYHKLDAGPSYHKPYMAVLLLIKTLRVVREIKPDVLHAHGWDSQWVAWWVYKLTGIPFVFDMQGSFSGEVAEHGFVRKGSLYFRFLSWLEKLSLKSSPVVVTSSEQIREESKARFHLADDHLLPIYDGVDTDTFSPQNFPPDPALRASLNLPDKPIIVFMGLLKTYQGVDDMIEAVRVLVQERGFTDFHFLVMGFPDEDHYRAMAAQKGIAEYLTFTGKIPYQETGHYLALADMAIAPKISMTEGDAKIYFYMAMGLPVVTYERPASLEILGDLGLYARYNDPVDMARALHETLAQGPEFLRERGAANRQKAINKYSWAAVARGIVGGYEKALRIMRPEKSGGSSLWRWVRLLMGVIGLLLLVTVVDVRQVSAALRDANWSYLLLAWALTMASTVTKTARWWLLMRQNQVKIGFQRLLGTYLIGTFYSQFLPGSAAGGDAMRMAESSVDTGQAVNSVSSVIIERAIGLISIVTTASLILLINRPDGIPKAFMLVIDALTICGITALVVLRFGWFVGPITRLMTRLKLGKLAQKVRDLSDALQSDLGNIRVLAWMVALSLLANFFSMTAFYLALLAVTEPVSYFGFISIVALIVTIEAIPLTPGSLGIREGAYVFFLGYLDVPEATALSIGLLIRVLGWTQALMGGLILMQRGFSTSGKTPAVTGGD